MSVSTIVTIASCLIAFGSLITAIIVLIRNTHKDSKEETKESISTLVKLQSQLDISNALANQRLESIDNGVRDLKSDNRQMRATLTSMKDELKRDINKVHDEAKHAIELAEAAHRRLNRAGIEEDEILKTKEK